MTHLRVACTKHEEQTVDDKQAVHDALPARRLARGVRMDEDLWCFVDEVAAADGSGSASKVIERWIRERRETLRQAA